MSVSTPEAGRVARQHRARLGERVGTAGGGTGPWWVLLLLDLVDAACGSQVPGGCGCRDSQASGTRSQLVRIFQFVVIHVGSRFA